MIKRDSKGRFRKGQPSLKGMLGKKQTDTWKKEQSERLKEQYSSGKRISYFKNWSWNKGKKCNYLIGNQFAKGNKPNKTSFKKGKDNKNFGKDWSNMKGENHYNWKGGITPEIVLLRQSAKYQIWRNAVYLRDDFTCQNPDCKYCKNKQGSFLHAHHIKLFSEYSELRFNIGNGITYCRNYHAKLHSNLRNKLIIG